MLFASLLLAAEEEAGGADLLIPDLRELAAGIIAFAIVFFFIWKYAVPAFNDLIETRQKVIKADLEAAEAEKNEAAALKADYQKSIANARQEATQIVEEARQAGESTRADIVARAETEAAGITSRATEELQSERERAVTAMRREVAGLSLDVAEKLVGRNLDHASQQALVDQFINELGNGG